LHINLLPDKSGQVNKQQRHADVLFVLSTLRNLPPVIKIHEDRPQALFITPEDETTIVDLYNQNLVNLERIEGMTKEECRQRALNAEKEF
jgi:hypothetical protein